MKVTLFTKKNCQPCAGSKRALQRNKIAFEEIDVASSPDAADPILELGYRAAPVVIVSYDDRTEHWDGYRPDRIEGLARYLAGEEKSA